MSKDKLSKNKQNTLNIREFPIHKMKPGATIVIIGKRASGKSVLIKDIIQIHKHNFPIAKILCGSEENNHFYSQTFHDLYIHNEYDEKALQDLEKHQKMVINKYGVDSPESRALLIIDDCNDDPKMLNRPMMQKYFKNGRHLSTAMMLALQYGMDIKPNIRSNIDYIFIFREPNENNRKNLFKNYAGIVGSYPDFCDLMDIICQDYTALVIDNRVQSNNLEDCVFYYKAKIHEKVEFGCLEYKQWAEARYNKDYMKNIF